MPKGPHTDADPLRRHARMGEHRAGRMSAVGQQASFREALRVFAAIGLMSFGGPAAQIALMHRALVQERQWLTERQFLNALSFCMLLPGPEAMQLATYAGWRLHGVRGGLVAGGLFVLPGACVIFALGMLYVTLGSVPLVDALFTGVQAVAVVIVVEALIRVARKALGGAAHWILAGAAFIAIYAFDVPFPAIIAVAALCGALLARPGAPSTEALPPRPPLSSTFRIICIGIVLWAAPVLLAMAIAPGSLLAELGIFFSKLAVVTFGGAYAVLAYMAQDVVSHFGWLTATQMMDGLGLAETTPGPLILVTQFVGFVAAFQVGGLGLAVLGGLMTLWVTFVPCFIWIFAGAPYIERLSSQPRLAAALQAITAAVVGVMLNLSLWFAMHVLFGRLEIAELGPARLLLPDLTSISLPAVTLILLASGMVFGLRWPIWATLSASALAALGLSFLMG